MVAIERERNRLTGILPKNFARPELDKRRLGKIVDLFTNNKLSDYKDYKDKKDVPGRTYEYCLAVLAEQERRRAGKFYTPSIIVRTLVETLGPCNSRVYDLACEESDIIMTRAESHDNSMVLKLHPKNSSSDFRKIVLVK